jgi:hypothetical protein
MKARFRSVVILSLAIVVLLLTSSRLPADTGMCGGAMTTLPFADVMGNQFFCQIAEAFFSGLTNGTTPTTYSPSDSVPRQQMAAFITRTQDSALRRGSKRAALNQWWTTQTAVNLGLTDVGSSPTSVQSDGVDLWVANFSSSTVSQIQASNGKLVGTWTGATDAQAVLVAMGKIFVTGLFGLASPSKLYELDPTQVPGPVTVLTSLLGGDAFSIAFDGQRIWTANGAGSVSIVTVNPVTVINVSTGFSQPSGILFDGSNIWVTDSGDSKLKMLDASGNVLLSVSVGGGPLLAVFDGTNIWVPNRFSNSVSVVRATGTAAGSLLATLTGGLNFPFSAAFDGERVLVTNVSGDNVSLWRASDLTPIGTFSTGTSTRPGGACSDGINFWITLNTAPPGKLARF